MNKEEIEKIFTTIDKINSPYYEISRERMYKIKECIEDLYNQLQDKKQENKELKEEYKNEFDENCKLSELWCKSQNNWNELKEYCKKETIRLEMVKEVTPYNEYIDRKFYLKEILNKMQELESRK